jgi:hypothetical protein
MATQNLSEHGASVRPGRSFNVVNHCPPGTSPGRVGTFQCIFGPPSLTERRMTKTQGKSIRAATAASQKTTRYDISRVCSVHRAVNHGKVWAFGRRGPNARPAPRAWRRR